MSSAFLASGNFNNGNSLGIAAFNIWNETGTAVGILEWFTVAEKEWMKYSNNPHGDELETSLLLVSENGRLVKLDKAVANTNPSPPLKDEMELWERGLQDKFTYSLDSRYLQQVGNWGDPTRITEEGEELWKKRADEVIDVTVDVGVKLIKALEKHVKKPK